MPLEMQQKRSNSSRLANSSIQCEGYFLVTGESIDATIWSILRANVLISSTRVFSVLRSSAQFFDYKFALLSIYSGRAVCLTTSPTILQCALVLNSLSSEQWQQCHRFSCTCYQIDYLLYSLSGTNHSFLHNQTKANLCAYGCCRRDETRILLACAKYVKEIGVQQTTEKKKTKRG